MDVQFKKIKGPCRYNLRIWDELVQVVLKAKGKHLYDRDGDKDEGKGRVQMETKTVVMLPQSREHLELPEAGPEKAMWSWKWKRWRLEWLHIRTQPVTTDFEDGRDLKDRSSRWPLEDRKSKEEFVFSSASRKELGPVDNQLDVNLCNSSDLPAYRRVKWWKNCVAEESSSW